MSEPEIIDGETGAGRVSGTPTVVQALSAVMEEVQAVKKGDRNTQQNYNFRGVDAVVNAVGPALRKHGVIVLPVAVACESEHYKTAKGTTMRGVTLTAHFRFYGPAGDYLDACVCGESSDSGDKAVPKAHSVAYRTLLLEALCIPTDEPDPDGESHERGQPANSSPRTSSARTGAAGGSLTEGAGGVEGPRAKPSAQASAENGITGQEVGLTAPSASDPQKKKLNVLVGQLRDQGHITTIQLYTALGRDLRNCPEGEVRWSPLRDSLTKTEAGELIERLERFQANVKAAESGLRASAEAAESEGDQPEKESELATVGKSSDSPTPAPSESAEPSLFGQIADKATKGKG